MKKNTLIFFIVISFIGSFFQKTFGQLEQPKRLEFEHNRNRDDEHTVFPLGKNGVLMMTSKVDYATNNGEIICIKYDTTLTEKWQTNYSFDKKLDLTNVFQNEKYLFVLFREENTTSITILRIDCETGDKIISEGVLSVNLTKIEQFLVLKNKAIFGGKYNDRPVVATYNIFDNSSKVLPELHANDMIINEVDVNENTENIYIMLKNERTCQFILKIFSYEGKLLSSVIIGEKNHNAISGKTLSLTNNETFLVGTYADACDILAQGLYLYEINSQNTKYINFSELTNFFKYLKPKQEKRMLDKISIRKSKGKEIKLRYRLLLHDLIPQSEGFLLVAEIYNLEMKSNNMNLGSYRTYQIGNQVYNNFRYSNAIICGFDKEGKLLWNNSFSLNNLESSELNAKTQVIAGNDVLIMAYPKEGIIKTEVLKKDKNDNTIENVTLKSNSENEKITDYSQSNLAAWYNGFFIAYGYQTIRNTKNPSLQKEVFYINKLGYLPK